jgi:PHD/YefM family antitoxin component YafN of YafNO toxin-antitoxin module
MIDVNNIRSLSDFQRNTKEHIKRLKKTGKAEVLTINGQAALVVQSAEAYQKLLDAADLADSVRILQARLEAAERGERGIPAERALSEIRTKLGLTNRP